MPLPTICASLSTKHVQTTTDTKKHGVIDRAQAWSNVAQKMILTVQACMAYPNLISMLVYGLNF